MGTNASIARIGCLVLAHAALAGCGGGGGNGGGNPPPPPPPPPPASIDPQYQVSNLSPFPGNCNSPSNGGTAYVHAEVEPYLAVNPTNPQHMVGAWQQDRWSNGSARGLVAGFSNDGGVNWSIRSLPFSFCGGGTVANGGDYTRATDPWVTIGPTGTVHAMSLSTSGGSFQPGSINAMLASRSLDGGNTWSDPATLIVDGQAFFNDKNAMTADPTRPGYVYATWDRLEQGQGGPTIFVRSIDDGLTWEAPQVAYDPGTNNQTIGNLVVVLPDGTLVLFFTAITGSNQTTLQAMRSEDAGVTWGPTVQVAEMLGIGATDPDGGSPVRDGAIIAQAAASPVDGTLYAVWQDARFSGGARDAIAFSRSTDGGATWSAPTRVNADPAVQAFTPSVHVSGDGTVGVTYYDFRSNTASTATLWTDYWLAVSSDGGATWSDTRVSPAFDLSIAANAGGHFVGDYQGLQDRDGVFIPFFVRTGNSTGNRSSVWAAPAVSAASAAQAPAKADLKAGTSRAAPGFVPGPRLRARVADRVEWTLDHRAPGWDKAPRQAPDRLRP